MTNKEPRHTPGPWNIQKAYSEEYWFPGKHYNAGPAYGMDFIEDAQLIAAAPDLLEALELLVSYTSDCEDPHDESGRQLKGFQKIAIIAINKAKGI